MVSHHSATFGSHGCCGGGDSISADMVILLQMRIRRIFVTVSAVLFPSLLFSLK